MSKNKKQIKNQNGFTLLEVIIAMAVLTMALVPLYAVFGGYLDAIKKTADENDKTQAKAQILTFMEAVNPDTQKQGNFEFSHFSFSWEANPIVGPFENTQDLMGKGNFTLSLYDTKITALKQAQEKNQENWFEFTLRQIGYTKKSKTTAPQEEQDPVPPEQQKRPDPSDLKPKMDQKT